MWANTPKELMEFYDYTFQDHFKKATPAFLPRKDLLDYVIARNSVDGALEGVKYSHTVLSVTYDEGASKFTVEVRDDTSGQTSKTTYDKCIWAAGLHGGPEKPDDIMSILEDYEGQVLHSMEATEDFQDHVKGKKIMLVGDSSSAEDLALRAVKLGAKHVYICARSGDGDCSDTKSWPSDKITVIYGPPYKVMKGTTFKCQGKFLRLCKQLLFFGTFIWKYMSRRNLTLSLHFDSHYYSCRCIMTYVVFLYQPFTGARSVSVGAEMTKRKLSK